MNEISIKKMKGMMPDNKPHSSNYDNRKYSTSNFSESSLFSTPTIHSITKNSFNMITSNLFGINKQNTIFNKSSVFSHMRSENSFNSSSKKTELSKIFGGYETIEEMSSKLNRKLNSGSISITNINPRRKTTLKSNFQSIHKKNKEIRLKEEQK